MTIAIYDPPPLEVKLTLGLGLTALSPYYRQFARQLNLRGDEHVLDFGSGSGICSRHIAARLQRGGHLTCVDISQGWMNVIRRTLRRYDNVNYKRGHITALDLPTDSYDVIVIHFVLHDIPAAERPAIMRALARTLKPGGRLVLREPQEHGLSRTELQTLAVNAGLLTHSLIDNKTVIGQHFDGIFTQKEIS